MKNLRFKVWHKGNSKFEYATIEDIWKNGWQCCEATRQPPKCLGDIRNNIETRQMGVFTTDKCLDEIAKQSFTPMANWMLCKDEA